MSPAVLTTSTSTNEKQILFIFMIKCAFILFLFLHITAKAELTHVGCCSLYFWVQPGPGYCYPPYCGYYAPAPYYYAPPPYYYRPPAYYYPPPPRYYHPHPHGNYRYGHPRGGYYRQDYKQPSSNQEDENQCFIAKFGRGVFGLTLTSQKSLPFYLDVVEDFLKTTTGRQQQGQNQMGPPSSLEDNVEEEFSSFLKARLSMDCQKISTTPQGI